jgi:hypothetical protein
MSDSCATALDASAASLVGKLQLARDDTEEICRITSQLATLADHQEGARLTGRLAIFRSGAVRVVVDAMDLCSESQAVTLQGMELLASLSATKPFGSCSDSCHDDHTCVMCECDGCGAWNRSCSRWAERIAAPALSAGSFARQVALGQRFLEDISCRSVADAGGVRHAVRALRTHADDPLLVAHACRVLRFSPTVTKVLSSGSVTVQECLWDTLLPAAIRAMREQHERLPQDQREYQPDLEEVLRRITLEILHLLCAASNYDGPVIGCLLAAEAPHAIVLAVHEHPQSVSVHEVAMRALAALHDHESNKEPPFSKEDPAWRPTFAQGDMRRAVQLALAAYPAVAARGLSTTGHVATVAQQQAYRPLGGIARSLLSTQLRCFEGIPRAAMQARFKRVNLALLLGRQPEGTRLNADVASLIVGMSLDDDPTCWPCLSRG